MEKNAMTLPNAYVLQANLEQHSYLFNSLTEAILHPKSAIRFEP
jgi:hypothetical protein